MQSSEHRQSRSHVFMARQHDTTAALPLFEPLCMRTTLSRYLCTFSKIIESTCQTKTIPYRIGTRRAIFMLCKRMVSYSLAYTHAHKRIRQIEHRNVLRGTHALIAWRFGTLQGPNELMPFICVLAAHLVAFPENTRSHVWRGKYSVYASVALCVCMGSLFIFARD